MASKQSKIEALNSKLESGEAWVFHRSPRSVLPEFLILSLLTLGAAVLTANYPALSQKVDFILSKSFSLPALIPLIYLAYVIHRLRDSRYTVTADRVRATHGRLSFRKQDHEIDIADIRGVEIDRPFLGRLLNYGNLEIGTAAHQGEEIIVEGIFDPSLARDVILGRKKAVISEQEKHASGSSYLSNE